MEHRTWNIEGKEHARYASLIRATCIRACKLARCPKESAVSVVFVGDKKMRELNLKYRGKDKTTNVLAFSGSSQFTVHSSQFDLGDVFISLSEAKREAEKYGWTIQYEIARLALHGFLHLLGYDHEKDKDAEVMEGIEEKILKHYGEH